MCPRCILASASFVLVVLASEPVEIITTIPSDCNALDTLPGDWNAGKCKEGAAANRWQFLPNGTFLETSPDYCSEGSIRCSNRAAKAWSQPHLLYLPETDVSRSNLLVVFLPGTGGPPSAYSRLCKAASAAGHIVIGLSYLSMPIASAQANMWCDPHPPGSNATPSQCSHEFHQHMLFGRAEDQYQGKSADIWPVTEKDSIQELVRVLLKDHGQPWGKDFLIAGDAVDWSKIIISGHSQGASHAAYLSQTRRVRAVLFSGPQDTMESAKEWAALDVPSNVVRRSLYHAHEECADEPRDLATHCKKGLLGLLLQLMGLGIESQWTLGQDLPDSLENVVTEWNRSSSCTSGRFWHSSTAQDKCAPLGAEKLWQALFSGPEMRLSQQDLLVSSAPMRLVSRITVAVAVAFWLVS